MGPVAKQEPAIGRVAEDLPAAVRTRPSRAITKRGRYLGGGGLLAVGVAVAWCVWQFGRNDVLDEAYAIPDGGGYCALNDSGVSETIKHNGSVILPASRRGSYCCGFTFAVAMKVAARRGLLADKSVAQVRQFQREWYGSAEGTGLRECAAAVADLGVGHEVPWADAAPGDFVTFQRKGSVGHSVVFVNWMRDARGQIVGLRYRSSQPVTDGVGDRFEYFDGTAYQERGIDRAHFYVARLNTGWWWRVTHPLGS